MNSKQRQQSTRSGRLEYTQGLRYLAKHRHITHRSSDEAKLVTKTGLFFAEQYAEKQGS
jgi:hypothetical protein